MVERLKRLQNYYGKYKIVADTIETEIMEAVIKRDKKVQEKRFDNAMGFINKLKANNEISLNEQKKYYERMLALDAGYA